ncbi:hypothetical protein C7974DRAFT_416962 [Boeremia exigua]|uniref:uncharacterized protein n=1 Tax=Boeremia exigua TaxID=749465 RepID=UPI001E8CADB3|nr:uncharacterized protein C7974DRAFT_416962 [Boeremia exigua]KAH6616847.1 hypothetical protein C7974DRAFT_416962 [Boeremia exigua]
MDKAVDTLCSPLALPQLTQPAPTLTQKKPSTSRRNAHRAIQKVNIEQFNTLYMHSPSADVPLEDALVGINEAHKLGFFRRFGLSNYAPRDVQHVHNLGKEKGYPLLEVLEPFNLTNKQHEEEYRLIVLLSHKNIVQSLGADN